MKNNLRPMPHVWLLLYTIDRISNSSAHTSRNHIHSGRITNHLRQAITSSTRGHFHNISLAIDTYTGLNIINGSLQFVSLSAQRFDENAAGTFVPAAYSWPSTMNMQQESELRSELQRLLTLLHEGTLP